MNLYSVLVYFKTLLYLISLIISLEGICLSNNISLFNYILPLNTIILIILTINL